MSRRICRLLRNEGTNSETQILGALETGSQKLQVALSLHYLAKKMKYIYDSDLPYHLA